jgi:hypothetical protein
MEIVFSVSIIRHKLLFERIKYERSDLGIFFVNYCLNGC